MRGQARHVGKKIQRAAAHERQRCTAQRPFRVRAPEIEEGSMIERPRKNGVLRGQILRTEPPPLGGEREPELRP